jgi:hemolysin III
MANRNSQDIYKLLKFYPLREEIANAVTHGIGAGLSIAGLTLLLVLSAQRGAGPGQMAAFAVYGASLVLLHISSTLYHSFQAPRARLVFRILDHGSIYLLIAGTYTPFLVVGMPSRFSFTLLSVIWVLALLGILRSALLIGRFRTMSTMTYLLMGWLVVVASKQLVENIAFGGLILLLAGGLAYTVGVIFFAWKKLPFNHAIWHLFVLAGSTCHYFAILYYLVPSV